MPAIGKSSTIQLDSIVFATDFSPASQNAGLYASAVSRHFGTSLVVAHAFTLSQAALEVEVAKSRPSQQRFDLQHSLNLAAQILDAGRGETESLLIEGEPGKVISALAEGRKPSLIVLGTHGGGSVDRFIVGSVAEDILRHSAGAALTVGPKVNILSAGALNVRRILYATDCSGEAARAAPAAVALAEAFSAELDVLNVAHSNDVDDPEKLRLIQQRFYGTVCSILPDRAGKLCEENTFVVVGEPGLEILKHLEERAIDLLILGLKRNAHLGMKNRTSGAFPIIIGARCPVVTIAFGLAE
jgi:nucleotide-binding universal stress UspA family protein